MLLHALPLFHGDGLFVSSNVALATGASLQLLPRFDTGEVIAALPRATVFMGVPTSTHRLLGDKRLTPRGLQRHAALHLRLGAARSGRCSATSRRERGTRIVERYGATRR